MKILFCGDIVGKPGRDAFVRYLPRVKDLYAPDFVIVNGENAAHGFGITCKIYDELRDMGVDVVTLGNHAFDQKDILAYFDYEANLLFPQNLSSSVKCRGHGLFESETGKRIVVINLMGRLFMDLYGDPFPLVDDILKPYQLGQNVDAIFVDFHAEASSEKACFAYHLDGRVSAVVGTHTHVPTADERILPKGTAFMTDVGMCGTYDSVIGMKKEKALGRFLKTIPAERLEPAEGPGTFCAVLVETDEQSGLATTIQPIRLGGDLKTTEQPLI